MHAAVPAVVDAREDCAGEARDSEILTSRPNRPYVVGIGASAGGLEALERFFEHVPPRSGLAFVVVQHLSPDFKSLMDEILARRTNLPIRLVEHGMEVVADHVYLIPPKKEMIIAGGRLLLSDRVREQELSLPIDIFFRSLAEDCASRAAAVVLSGGGTDGSRGVRAVHEAGGLVLVQNMETAQFGGMPRSARDSGVADYVLAPQEMPQVILDHIQSSLRAVSGVEALADHGMSAVYRMLEREFGIDFTHYKPSTVTRRIERRVALARAEDLEEYVRRLRAERDELDVLYRDLLIGVTRFFRNEEAFQVLEEKVLPELLASLPAEGPLRLWVVGCATGEEVYSLAIVVHELMQRFGERPVKIFATDVHRGSIESATRGLYDEQAVANVSPARLERYFVRRGRGFQVVPDIRQMVVFALHNVINDAPFTRVDFVSCRNMLIYLQSNVQRKVLGLFQFALRRGGYLFLGPSESPGDLIRDFETVDKHWRIYRKRSDARAHTEPRIEPPSKPTAVAPGSSFTAARGALGRYSLTGLLSVYDGLLNELVPPSLLVNERDEIVHSFGGASRFLKLRDGRQALDVLEMVSADLRVVLTGALSRAGKHGAPVVFRGVRALDDDDARYNVTVRRVQPSGGLLPHILITFEPLAGPRRAPARESEVDVHQLEREQFGALEAELRYTKENLKAATEELETSNEELQAANEELLASNEELQSTNEELQSVNEELYSVNAEYQRKIADLTELSNDMENLLASTDVGTIFLDRQLRIRKFTEQAAETFNLMPQDVGRPISTFRSTMEYATLGEDLKEVLATGVPVERQVRDARDRYLFLRILPYRANGAVDGVVLTQIDVTGMRAAEDALFHERYLLNSLLSSVPDAIYFKDARGRFIRANDAMAARLGLADPKAAVGKTSFELQGPVEGMRSHEQDERVLRTGTPELYAVEERAGADGQTEWDVVSRLPLRDREDKVVGMIGIFRCITEQKRAEEYIQEAVRRRDQFLAMLSHELRNPLGATVSATALLKERLGMEGPHARLLTILDRQTRQMARLLDDLLEVSRVTQDKIELRMRAVDLIPVVKEAVDAARGLMEARGIQFNANIPSGPLYVYGDPARLQQIQANLLSNAAKYTPSGGHVWLDAQVEGEEIVISVRDDGVGIPKHILDTVFELFVQSNRTLDRAEGGLGVGLTLVRRLVDKHGGIVTAHSDGEGKGSRFVVRLPLVPAQSQSVTRSSSAPDDAAPGPRVQRVLVVEDNADSRSLLCELLEAAGFECHNAENGETGLAMLDRIGPDVVVADIGLPVIDGLEFARRVRQDERHAHVLLIALTGYGQTRDRDEALSAGFDRHLVKPVDSVALVRMISECAAAANVSPPQGP